MSNKVKQISRAHYNDKLEVLPPENWVRGNFEHFRMMEYYSLQTTQQYAAFAGIYLEKLIDVTDKSTWITIDDFEGLEPLPPEQDNIGFYI